MSFENFGLSPELMNGLADTNMNEPTPLQQNVLPAALEGKSLLVKCDAEDEGAFLIPALQTLTMNGEVSGTRILILTPSIERAKKIDELVWALGYHAQISPADVSMKGDKSEQEKAVLDGAPVIVANPGRLIDILEKTNTRLNSLATIVIDEAHNMENYSLVSRVKSILKYVDNSPQTLIFSESMNKATSQLADAALMDPVYIGFDKKKKQPQVSDTKEDLPVEEKLKQASVKVVLNPEAEEAESPDETNGKEISNEEKSPEEKLEEASVEVVLDPEEKDEDTDHDPKEKLKDASVKVVLKDEAEEPEPIPSDLTQAYINVPPRMKISTLLAHLESSPIEKVIVFTASKRTVDRLFRIILKKNWGVVSVYDGIDKETYDERFAKFTSGEMKVLLAGGLSASEIEIDEVQQVINYDVPGEVEEYRYRAELVGNGKAARMVSLVSKMDKEDIDRIVAEVGYAPAELKLPKEVKEKKQKKPENKKAQPTKKPTDRSQSGRSDHRSKRNSGTGKDNRRSGSKGGKNQRGSSKSKNKSQKGHELPRPTYEGLSGGRDGNKSSGVFGWVKKLFD